MKNFKFLTFWLIPLIFTSHLFSQNELEDLKRYTKELEEAFKAKIQMDESITPTSVHKELKINFDKLSPNVLGKIKGEAKGKLFDVLSANELTTKNELDNAITTSQEVLIKLKEENQKGPEPQSPTPTPPAPLPLIPEPIIPQGLMPPVAMPEPIPAPTEIPPMPTPSHEIIPPPMPEPLPITPEPIPAPPTPGIIPPSSMPVEIPPPPPNLAMQP
ncbi:MAG: hypothetical protein ABIA74_03770 [bacterium]